MNNPAQFNKVDPVAGWAVCHSLLNISEYENWYKS